MTGQARSNSDRELADLLSVDAKRVTGWQVERWRQAGLIPPAQRRSLGRGGGSAATYTTEAIEQARVVASLVRRRRPISEVAIALFMRRYPVGETVLRGAFADWIDRLERWFGPQGTDEAKFDLAEKRAPQLLKYSGRTRHGRRVMRRARRLPEDPEAIALSVYTNLLLILQGGDVPDDAIAEMLQVAGLGAFLEDRAAGMGPIASGFDDQVLQLVKQFNLASLRLTCETASMADFVAAREILLVVVPFARAFAVMARTLFKLPDAFGFSVLEDMADDEVILGQAIPMVLLGRELFETPQAQALTEYMAGHLEYFRGSADFIQGLPSQVRRRLGKADPTLLDSLPPDDAARIRKAASSLLAEGEARGFATDTGPPASAG